MRAAALGLCLAAAVAGPAKPRADGPGTGKIKHVIILMEENRSFDHVFGWYNRVRGPTQSKVNGLDGGNYSNTVVDSKTGHRTVVPVDDKAPQIRYPIGDPCHGTSCTTRKIFNGGSTETMGGFAQDEDSRKDYNGVMSMFKPENVPVITQLAQEFALFDEFFCSHPGPTWPNRQFAISGTSEGNTGTGGWYQGKPGQLYPSKTIMDQVAAANLTWRNYYNDTPWELFMETIAHNPDKTLSLEEFYADARDGTLPSYAWINPSSGINVTTGIGSSDQHPDHDMAAGEALYKSVYEALRASPQWNETLFVLTYDEHGGFYDHVPPPQGVPPPSPVGGVGNDGSFKFDRLGVRIPTLLISPWVAKGRVIPAPKKAAFDLTTLVATTRRLLKLPDEPLTKRDEWVATFEEYLDEVASPRTDCPMHLVDAIPSVRPAGEEAGLELNGLQQHIGTVHSHAAGRRVYTDPEEFGPHEGVHTQGQVGAHLRTLREEHLRSMTQARAAHAAELARNAERYLLTVIAASLVPEAATTSFLVNVTGPSRTLPWVRVETLNPFHGETLCFDAGSDPVAVAAGSPVGLTRCADALPASRGQRWVWESDSTVRPYYAQGLCLTNTCADGTCGDKKYPAVLLPCADGRAAEAVAQRWAYHGEAPGNSRGPIYFGDCANLLAILPVA